MANCQVSVVENTAYVLSSLFEKVKKIQEKNRKEKEREKMVNIIRLDIQDLVIVSNIKRRQRQM